MVMSKDQQKVEVSNLKKVIMKEKELYSKVDLSIHDAIIFASRKHDKQYRKSTNIPYISHIMEVMQILIENVFNLNWSIYGSKGE